MTIERQAQPSCALFHSLKDGEAFAAGADLGADPRRSLCGDVAELDAAAAIDRYGVFVGGIVGLRYEIDRLARRAKLQFEAPRGSSLVRVIDTDDGKRPRTQRISR